jgi:phosphate transport system protein
MAKHMQREIEKLKKQILSLGALVEESVRHAVVAIEDHDADLAQRVIDGDSEVDQMEVDIEEECLKILALYQPVAVDLRFIVAVLKINNDLERIADLAVNIAERAVFLAKQPPTSIPFDFHGMAEKAQSMLRRGLDALVNMDAMAAQQVCLDDDEVDAINRQMYGLVKEGIRHNIESVDQMIHLLSVSRHVERIADQATNIAEDIIYMIQGEIVRHRTEDYIEQHQQRGKAPGTEA